MQDRHIDIVSAGAAHAALEQTSESCSEANAGGDEPASNVSSNPIFTSVVEGRFSRRGAMAGGLAAAMTTLFASRGNALGVLFGDRTPTHGSIGFDAIPIYNGDGVSVPAGYTATPFFVVGSPILGPDVGNPAANTVEAFENCSGAEMEQRVGSHHDGMHYFPSHKEPNDRGLLCVNHEYVDPRKMFPESGTNAYVASGTRPADQVRKTVAAHGVTVAEIVRNKRTGAWSIAKSPYNRRITGETPMTFSGPVAGSDFLKTKYSPDGKMTRGTLNNCAHGVTPWGTYLTCEENWASYFAAGSDSARREFRRFGVGANSNRYGWDMADAEPTASATNPDPYRRFRAESTGASATEDYRNEPIGQGWTVEIDPWDPKGTPVKHTSLGRCAREGTIFAPAQQGQPVACYIGDDSTNEYIYKFVSKGKYFKRTAGSHLLAEGTLYAAKFHEDGSGEWLPLDIHDKGFRSKMAAAIADPRSVWPGGQYDDFNGFNDQADVLVNTRLAADVAGATPMDRPEWGAVHPKTGEVYFALTNNTSRDTGGATSPAGPIPTTVDAANPRARNEFGHIIRWREHGNRGWALKFDWDLFVLAGPTDDSVDPNGEPLTLDNMFASPDGLWFDDRGVLWIQTDKGTGQQVVENERFGNNQMLAANPDTGEIRRFFQGPLGQETTGVITTPNGRTMFINLQHPGEGSESNPILASTYPDGPGSGSRGRSCTMIITKNDRGIIGT